MHGGLFPLDSIWSWLVLLSAIATGIACAVLDVRKTKSVSPWFLAAVPIYALVVTASVVIFETSHGESWSPSLVAFLFAVVLVFAFLVIGASWAVVAWSVRTWRSRNARA